MKSILYLLGVPCPMIRNLNFKNLIFLKLFAAFVGLYISFLISIYVKNK